MARFGQQGVFRTVGTLRAVWLIGLAGGNGGYRGYVDDISLTG